MKEYTVEFEDIVKYRFKVMAKNELDAKRIVSRMEVCEFDDYEIDNNFCNNIESGFGRLSTLDPTYL